MRLVLLAHMGLNYMRLAGLLEIRCKRVCVVSGCGQPLIRTESLCGLQIRLETLQNVCGLNRPLSILLLSLGLCLHCINDPELLLLILFVLPLDYAEQCEEECDCEHEQRH